jgi:hypothetical protein
MKKLFVLLAVAAFMLSTGCNNATTLTLTPSNIEEMLLEQIQKGDYEQAMTVFFDNLDSNESWGNKQEFVAEFAQKSEESYELQGGLKSYEIIKEDISEDGKTAIVETKNIYGDGTEETNTTTYIRKDDGVWKISSDK